MDTERCHLYPLAHVKFFWLVEYVLITAVTYFFTMTDLYTPLPPIFWHIQGNGEAVGKQKEDSLLSSDFITVVRQDYFV
jgi:hypothetical protein